MKKADFMLSFLFWALVGLIIFIPTSLWASQFLKSSDRALSSYYKLLELVYQIREGELQSMPLYMDDNSAIIGISKISKRFELKSKIDTTIFTNYFEKSDPKCEGKACICLCRDIIYEKMSNSEGKLKCQELRCNSFDNLDFLKRRPLADFTIIQEPDFEQEYWWENGFIIVTQTNFNKLQEITRFSTTKNDMGKKLKTIYIQRYKNYVSVCYSKECITGEVKNEIDKYKK